MEILKKIYKKLLLVLSYTVIASFVYGYWFHNLWGLWYVTLITIIAIFGIGALIGYFYVRNDLKPNDEIKEVEPITDTPKELDPTSDLPIDNENK